MYRFWSAIRMQIFSIEHNYDTTALKPTFASFYHRLGLLSMKAKMYSWSRNIGSCNSNLSCKLLVSVVTPITKPGSNGNLGMCPYINVFIMGSDLRQANFEEDQSLFPFLAVTGSFNRTSLPPTFPTLYSVLLLEPLKISGILVYSQNSPFPTTASCNMLRRWVDTCLILSMCV